MLRIFYTLYAIAAFGIADAATSDALAPERHLRDRFPHTCTRGVLQLLDKDGHASRYVFADHYCNARNI